MKTMLIACSTVKEELTQALEALKCDIPVLWMESGLHDVPQKLNEVLQEQLDRAEQRGAERILLGYGFCGNAMAGLQTGSCELIIPRVEDCISLLIGSTRERARIQKAGGIYFMTKGWIEGERNIMREYEELKETYGEEEGEEIFQMMFGHYSQIGILDTGCYDMAPVIEQTKLMAETLQLGWEMLPASNGYLKELLEGPWEANRFLIVPPHTKTELSMLSLDM